MGFSGLELVFLHGEVGVILRVWGNQRDIERLRWRETYRRYRSLCRELEQTCCIWFWKFLDAFFDRVQTIVWDVNFTFRKNDMTRSDCSSGWRFRVDVARLTLRRIFMKCCLFSSFTAILSYTQRACLGNYGDVSVYILVEKPNGSYRAYEKVRKEAHKVGNRPRRGQRYHLPLRKVQQATT